MKRFLVVVLLLLSIFTLGACSSADNAELIIGTWDAEVDFSSIMLEEVKNSGFDEHLEDVEFVMTFQFEFRDDNILILKTDEEMLYAEVDTFFESLRPAYTAYFEKLLAERNMNMTVDELLTAAGTTMDELIKVSSNAAKDAMEETMQEQIYGYEVEEDKLYTWDEGETKDIEDYIVIEFSDKDTLKFIEENSNADDDITKLVRELKRVK